MVKFFEALYEELSLHVKYLAWLDAALEKAKHGKLSDRAAAVEGGRPQTRRAKMEADQKRATGSTALPLPPIHREAECIVRWLFDAGPVTSTGFGAVGITNEELGWWQYNSGIRLMPWQSTMIRQLSKDYAGTQRMAEQASCPAPWLPDGANLNREAIARKVKGLFR